MFNTKSFNRTFMELKQSTIDLKQTLIESFNRTFMELKLDIMKSELEMMQSFNRTFMELKCDEDGRGTTAGFPF